VVDGLGIAPFFGYSLRKGYSMNYNVAYSSNGFGTTPNHEKFLCLLG
jgi:hypothetical protein